MKKKILIIITVIFIVILLCTFINIILNNNVFVRKYAIYSNKFNEDFEEYRILQITDIHSIRNEKQIEKIISKIKNEKPDMICVTGDLIDATYYVEQNALYENGKIDQIETLTIKFMEKLVNIADTYYIYGNHEMMLLDDPENNVFKVALQNIGVKLLNNSFEIIDNEKITFNMIGIQDPSTLYKDKKYSIIEGNNKHKVEVILKELLEEYITEENKNNFTILLSHRPEYFEMYDKYNIDLALTGHTHGGIAKLPLVRGIYAHPQGWFPKYSYGEYKTEDFTMIINGGIGYSKLPIRVFNPPEINVITLNKK